MLILNSKEYILVTINTDLNILGGLPDWNLINVFLNDSIESLLNSTGIQSYTSIKTDKSVKRFEKAISSTLIKFCKPEVSALVRNALGAENITKDTLLLLFWNASFNNELVNYLNTNIFFHAFYTGRISIKQDEVVACLKDLSISEIALKKWSDSTLQTTSSKYLTLLKKFNLMEGSARKSIVHPYLNDKMFIHFVYWLTAIETKSNLMDSVWLQYCFSEKTVFIERLMQKKFTKFFQIHFTGDMLKIETTLSYTTLYHAIT